MGPSPVRVSAVALAALGVSCYVAPVSWIGKRCDAANACPSDYVCAGDAGCQSLSACAVRADTCATPDVGFQVQLGEARLASMATRIFAGERPGPPWTGSRTVCGITVPLYRVGNPAGELTACVYSEVDGHP